MQALAGFSRENAEDAAEDAGNARHCPKFPLD